MVRAKGGDGKQTETKNQETPIKSPSIALD
ncbi:hypothetical protein X744_29745 [Mesorhizobium sp. LNJC372A00]|nr:hypothetical protein X744_29745 [Mesorhizobium sp. LNJC372A00]